MVTVKYKSGVGDTVYISSTEAKEFERIFESMDFNGTIEIRGCGPEAKVEGKPELIRILQEYYPDLICGAEYQKSNGKLSIRLSEKSRAGEKINATMKKVGETQRKEKQINEELVSKIDDFFKMG